MNFKNRTALLVLFPEKFTIYLIKKFERTLRSTGSLMASSSRERPALLRALGKKSAPETIQVDGTDFQLVETFKHDSWAATAKYAHSDRNIVCKFNRMQSVFGVPTSWLGRFLAQREDFAMQKMSHVSNIPDSLGPVFVDGVRWPNAVAHHYIPGHPLGAQEKVNDNFFPELLTSLQAVHEQKMAYVDLHKRENILVGEDEKPYLIDFQICYRAAAMGGFTLPTTKLILKMLQNSDLYHFTKHVKRLRPDQIDQLGLTKFTQRPWWIRAHRTVAVPFRTARRKFLTLIGVRGKSGRSSTETFAEHAFRCDQEQEKQSTKKAA